MREDLSQNPVGKREGGKICNFGLLEEEGAIFCYLYLTLELLPSTGRSKKRIILRSVQYGESLNGLWCNGSQKRRELTFTFLIFEFQECLALGMSSHPALMILLITHIAYKEA